MTLVVVLLSIVIGSYLVIVHHQNRRGLFLDESFVDQRQLSKKVIETTIAPTASTISDELKPLLPLNDKDYFGFLAAMVALLIAAGGGIGGGGLLVPIFLLIMDFPVRHAVSLSNVTVFGGAVGNAVLNARKKHPLADRPLIDWNLLAMMEPLTMVGALLGADLNEILPDVVVVILLVLLLGYTAIKTLQKVRVPDARRRGYREISFPQTTMCLSLSFSCFFLCLCHRPTSCMLPKRQPSIRKRLHW